MTVTDVLPGDAGELADALGRAIVRADRWLTAREGTLVRGLLDALRRAERAEVGPKGQAKEGDK